MHTTPQHSEATQGIALITGASSGIGAIYADRLAHRGYDLILVARNHQRLEAVAARITTETGRSVSVIVADLNEISEVAQVERILDTNIGITMLVNNAGISMAGDLAGADRERLVSLIQLNVLAPTLLARAVLPGFLARGRGTIINISSALALAPELFNGSYSGTKAYLLNLTQRLQQETAGTGVRVQAVLPGAVRTEIWERAGADLSAIPANLVMDAGELVDAALAGLDLGESVTIPSLPDIADWEAFVAARRKMAPNLSLDSAAPRYETVFAQVG